MWFANGIHHHYSLDKFLPEFSESYFDELVAGTPAEYFPQDFTPSVAAVVTEIKPVMFDPELFPKRTNQALSLIHILSPRYFHSFGLAS